MIEPECPGPDCLMCSGEACNLCGAGCWNNAAPHCEHDSLERHRDHHGLDAVDSAAVNLLDRGMPETNETTPTTMLDNHAATLAAHPPDEAAVLAPGGEPEGKRPDGPLEHFRSDVRSLWAPDDKTMRAILADVANPEASPQQLEGTAEEARNALIKAYRETITDALEMRRDLSSVEVFVQPKAEEDGSHSDERKLWDEYTERLYSARNLRAQL